MRSLHLRYLLLLGALALLGPLALAAPAGAAVHVVAAGETLTSVAAADGLSVVALAAANGLSPDAELVSGQTLVIPAQSGAVSSGYEPEPVAASTGLDEGAYVVQPGDTLSAIAARAGTSVASLAAVNGLDPYGYLDAGTVLSLDGLAPASAAGAGGTVDETEYVSSSSTASASEAAPSSAGSVPGTGLPPYPTPETVSSGEVGTIAADAGVPAALADAVGWQESGFNNDEVSPTGATGVMQIEPGTWSWIQSSLAANELAPASAHDNVLGGVLLLHQLLADTGGDETMAAAAYYQGLASVQQYGMYPSTQAYVNDVLALDGRFGG